MLNLTITNIGLNIGLYWYGIQSNCYGDRPKTEQRKSAYVSRKPVWRTLPEPSSNIYNYFKAFLPA